MPCERATQELVWCLSAAGGAKGTTRAHAPRAPGVADGAHVPTGKREGDASGGRPLAPVASGGALRHACRMRALRLLLLGVAVVAALPLAGALAAASKTFVLSDAKGDVSGPLDIQRSSMGLASDGRLRIVLTFADKVAAKDLLATAGPPGSMCVRIWTDGDADPTSTRPDKLVCVTADKDAKLRAGVYDQPDAALPRRSGPATVSANKSGRSFVLRVAQSALGRPRLLRVAFEATRPGCDRRSCVDNAPDDGAVRRFRLR
jgi:hypothetical protein